MGFIDGLTDANFLTDIEGRQIFYRWRGFFGIFWCGKGYVLPDEVKKQEIRRFVKRYYRVSFPIIIASVTTVGVLSFFLLPPLFLWYLFGTSRLLKGLDVAGERLTLRESVISSAKSQNLATLWVMLIFSILAVLACFGLVFYRHGSGLLELGGIVLFGVMAIIIGYMIKLRSEIYRGHNNGVTLR